MKQNWNIVHGPFALQMRFVFTLIWRKGEQSAAKWSSFKFVTARLEPGFWVVDALSLSAPLSQTPPLSAFCFVALRCEKSMRMVCAEFVVVISGVCVCGREISRAANQQNLPFSLFFGPTPAASLMCLVKQNRKQIETRLLRFSIKSARVWFCYVPRIRQHANEIWKGEGYIYLFHNVGVPRKFVTKRRKNVLVFFSKSTFHLYEASLFQA